MDQNPQISIKALYDQYWHCRDFEIKNLWQRSIFLGAFLILCFSGYGFFFCKAFFGSNGKLNLLCDTQASVFTPCIQAHLIAIFIASIGVILSVLWVYLAKASKAWVEVYEAAISSIDQKNNFMPTEFQTVGGFHMEKLPSFGSNESSSDNDCAKFSNNIFSCKGGTFSPSKINICIGQISLLIWALIITLHLSCCSGSIAAFVITLAVVIGVIISVCISVNNKVQSSVLSDKDPIKVFKQSTRN